MTTPPPDLQPAAETLEEIAAQIVAMYYPDDDELEGAILSALRNERERAFDQGFILAVAEIMRTHGEDVIAQDVLRANRPQDWSIIDEVDIKALQPIFDHEAAQAEIQKLQAIREGK